MKYCSSGHTDQMHTSSFRIWPPGGKGVKVKSGSGQRGGWPGGKVRNTQVGPKSYSDNGTNGEKSVGRILGQEI